MWADGTMRPTKIPRCLILGTGEDTPQGHSLRASMLILELSPGDLDWALLSECQLAGSEGIYANVVAGFLKWIAKRFDQHVVDLRLQLIEYRNRATGSSSHRRTPELVANLAAGCRLFLRFCQAVGAINRRERDEWFDQAWAAIGDAAVAQEQFPARLVPNCDS